jgi:recombination protein RecT
MFTINRALGIEISAQVIYQDDEFTYDMNDGIITNIKHKQEFKNIKKDKMVGAYAIAVDQETREFNRAEVMNMDQIKESWSKSRTDKDKKKHTEQYAKRSVLNRLSTWFIETQDIENGLIDVAVKNEQKHYDYEEVEVVDETQKVISFETKEETTPHNEDTGEVVEEVGDCLRCEFEPCSRRTVDVDDKLSKASMETPGCFSDERESDKSFKNVEA